MPQQLEHIVCNLSGPSMRVERLEGREYRVVPMVMLTHGVHAGSQGPLYYPDEELGRRPGVWNHKPVVVYHPEINGVGVSACSPSVLNERKVGIILNTDHRDQKLPAEAWLDWERLREVDERVVNMLERGEMVEISTGLFCDNESHSGEFNGKPYSAIVRNMAPDHLAILPDKKGACSIEDGAGLLRNEAGDLSSSNILRQLDAALSQMVDAGKPPFSCYVEDLYPTSSFFVYRNGDKLLKQTYTIEDGKVVVGQTTPVPVKRVTEYRTESGAFVGNARIRPLKKENEGMKKDLIDKLVANVRSGWKEEDRLLLDKMEEPALTRLVANADALPPAEDPDDDLNPDDDDDLLPPDETVRNMTPEQYIATAPPAIQSILIRGLAVHNVQKAAAIDRIVANAGNRFTKEFLALKELDELEGMCALAQASAPVTNQQGGVPMFYGAAGPNPQAPITNELLPVPSMDFTKPA
jgi:hypothetical protein